MKVKESAERFDLAVVTKLKDGSQVKASRRVIHTATRAIFPPGMTQQGCLEYLLSLRGFEVSVKIYRSDCLASIKKRFGDEGLRAAVDQLELNFRDMEEASMVAMIAPEHRHAKLTAEHYVVAGHLVNEGTLVPEKIASWMTVASEEQLGPEELKESIKAGHVVKRAAALPGTMSQKALIPLQLVGGYFIRWKKQMEERGFPIERIPLEQKREILEELRPILEFAEQLRRDLEASRS